MTKSNIIDMKIIDPCDGLILRFKNDFGGRDLIHFPGNYQVIFQSGNVQSVEVAVSDFLPASLERGREQVLSIDAVERIQCSRMVKRANIEGLKQLFSSRYVELFTGKKDDTTANKQNKWLQVQVSLRDWVERIKENEIFISIEIELPKRFVDEF